MSKKRRNTLYKVECPYCGRMCERVTGAVIYPHIRHLSKLLYYRCEPCGAYVGTHERTGAPYGLPANAELRRARRDAHDAFDPLWLNGPMHRKQAYDWMAKVMRLNREQAHIGMFSVQQCKQLIDAIANFKGITCAFKTTGTDHRFAGEFDPPQPGGPTGPDRKPTEAGDDAGDAVPA